MSHTAHPQEFHWNFRRKYSSRCYTLLSLFHTKYIISYALIFCNTFFKKTSVFADKYVFFSLYFLVILTNHRANSPYFPFFQAKSDSNSFPKVRTMLKWQSHSQPVLAAESSPHCTQKNRVYDKFPQAFIK